MRLDESNFFLYAAKHYDDKASTSMEEFQDDVKRFLYLRKLFKRATDAGDVKTRLILNHIIILYNCFGTAATHMLFFKLKDYHAQLKPFVLFLSMMPDRVEYEDEVIRSTDIALDPKMIEELRKI